MNHAGANKEINHMQAFIRCLFGHSQPRHSAPEGDNSTKIIIYPLSEMPKAARAWPPGIQLPTSEVLVFLPAFY